MVMTIDFIEQFIIGTKTPEPSCSKRQLNELVGGQNVNGSSK